MTGTANEGRRGSQGRASPRARRLRAALLLACALAHPAFSSALLASAVTLALHGSAHAHSVELVADDGHVDLVLRHVERRPAERCTAPVHAHQHLSHGESDHVLHVASDDATRNPTRKLWADPTPALVAAPPITPTLERRSEYRTPEQPRFRGSEEIRTVVLRL